MRPCNLDDRLGWTPKAVATLRAHGCRQLALLKCTSAYPASPDEMDLRTIPDMMARWDVPVGVSDHTLETTVPITRQGRVAMEIGVYRAKGFRKSYPTDQPR